MALPAAALLLAASALRTSGNPGAGFPEYQVKAEFLGRIARFVDWPAGAFGAKDEPFTIAVIGEDPFGKYLDQVAAHATVKGRRVEVRRLGKAETVGRCHMLFVAGGARGRLPEILSMTDGRPILVVGDGKKPARLGAVMGLYIESGRVRFNINLDAAKKNRLVISVSLLRLASAVYEGGE